MEDINVLLAEQFRRTDIKHRKALMLGVHKTDLYRSQHRLLMIINKNPNASQNEIAKELDCSPAAVTNKIKSLEEGGYISREISPKDNRQNCVALTDKGKQIVKQSIEIFKFVDSNMFAGLNSEEKNNLLIYLKKMYDSLCETESILIKESEEK